MPLGGDGVDAPQHADSGRRYGPERASGVCAGGEVKAVRYRGAAHARGYRFDGQGPFVGLAHGAAYEPGVLAGLVGLDADRPVRWGVHAALDGQQAGRA